MLDRRPRPVYPSDLVYVLGETIEFLKSNYFDESTWSPEEQELHNMLVDLHGLAKVQAPIQDTLIGAAVAFTTLWRPGDRSEDPATQANIVSVMNLLKEKSDEFVRASGGR